MRAHWNYFKYVLKHKWYVFQAGRKTGVRLWRLIIHDYSKFSRAEWTPYVNRFFAGRAGVEDKEKDPDEFRRAWLHHLHKNPHHWDHWVFSDGRPLDMPDHFIKEMVADWIGAGMAITGSKDISNWYNDVRDKHIMTEATKAKTEYYASKYGKWKP